VVKAICLSPDGSELAVSTFQGKLKFLDASSFTELREFDIPDFSNGGRISYAKDGKHVVLKKIRPNDHNLNKDNTQKIVIVNVSSGDLVVKHDKVYDLALAPDLSSYALMDKGVLSLYSFPDGKKLHTYSDDRLGSSIAYGPESKIIYSSRGFNKSDLKKDPRFKKNRKGRKAYSKYQQTIAGYSIDGLAEVFISQENMDEIYDLRLSKREDRILIYAKQDEKVNAAMNTNFILQMNLSTGGLLREQFNSLLPDPDYKENISKNIIGVTTNEAMDKSHSVMLYDSNTNEIIARFDVDSRFLEGLNMKTNLDGSACFEFSADGKYLLTCIGSNLYKWKIKRED
jgi:WD40 repeat protein